MHKVMSAGEIKDFIEMEQASAFEYARDKVRVNCNEELIKASRSGKDRAKASVVFERGCPPAPAEVAASLADEFKSQGWVLTWKIERPDNIFPLKDRLVLEVNPAI